MIEVPGSLGKLPLLFHRSPFKIEDAKHNGRNENCWKEYTHYERTSIPEGLPFS